MKQRQFKETAYTFRALQRIAAVIQEGTREEITACLVAATRDPIFRGVAWQRMLSNLLAVVTEYAPSRYAVFALNGNGKLPFVAFSTLPGVTCPGAGACLSFCYSYSAWRYPDAFGRQAQNAFLLRFRRVVITDALDAVARRIGDAFDLRLYVDGDFSSLSDVAFWMDALRDRPNIRAYGYSKSFAELLQFERTRCGQWPSNYRLNMSSGHAHDAATVARVRRLPITRGEFLAVNIGRRVRGDEHGTRAVNDAIRAAYRAQHATARAPFTCPGKCGACTPSGHACGSARFVGIPIAIAVH